MSRFLSGILILILAFALSFGAGDKTLLEASGDFYYNDVADVLDRETEASIYYNSKALCEATGAQIVIVTVRDANGMPVSDYAHELFNQWGVGDYELNNGFLLVMLISATPDHGDYFLSTGIGAGKILSDSEADDLLYEYLEPDFAVGNYDAGVNSLYKELFYRVCAYYGVNLAYIDKTEFRGVYDETAPAGSL